MTEDEVLPRAEDADAVIDQIDRYLDDVEQILAEIRSLAGAMKEERSHDHPNGTGGQQ